RIEEHGLVDLEQRVVQRAGAGEVAALDRFAKLGQRSRPQIPDGVHQPASAYRHHREAELLEADEDLERRPELAQALGYEAEIVHGVLNADEACGMLPKLAKRI